MSAIKKGIKKIGRFVKKYWKPILMVAAVVFTAGIATVGVAGFSAAATAAGGGVTGFLSAAGSTMVAGVSAIGGSLGIGKGAALAKFGGTGYATLGTGAAAQSMGLAGSNAAMTAARSMPSAALGGGPPSFLAGGAGNAVTTNAAGRTLVGNAAQTYMNSGPNAPVDPSGPNGGGGGGSGGGGFFSNPNSGMMLQAGMGLVNGYMQGRAEDEEWERNKPRGYWGVGLNGERDAQGPLFGGGGNGLMWDQSSFNRPGFTGNAALDAGQRVDPLAANYLNADVDPTAALIGGPSRGNA